MLITIDTINYKVQIDDENINMKNLNIEEKENREDINHYKLVCLFHDLKNAEADYSMNKTNLFNSSIYDYPMELKEKFDLEVNILENRIRNINDEIENIFKSSECNIDDFKKIALHFDYINKYLELSFKYNKK